MPDTPQDTSPAPQRRTQGIAIAAVVGLAVFGLGNLIIANLAPHVDLPAPPALAGQPGTAPSPPDAAPSTTADAAGSQDAEAPETGETTSARAEGGTEGKTDATAARAREAVPTAAPPEEREGSTRARDEAPEDVAGKATTGEPDCSLPDKDVAKEAWRRNLPTICVTGEGKEQKAALFLPFKGNAATATYDVRRHQRLLRIQIPGGESQLTMVQYKLRRQGFRDLRLSTDGPGSKVRLTFDKSAGDPQIELKDSYIKVVLPVPSGE